MTLDHPSAPEAPGRAFVGRKTELAELTAVLDHAVVPWGRLEAMALYSQKGGRDALSRLVAQPRSGRLALFLPGSAAGSAG
jgi:hypothetical protein